MIESLKKFYFSGQTRSQIFRRNCLKNLAAEINKNEDKILSALHKDLGKSKVEAYVSEIQIVLNEIKYTLKHMRKWMKKTPVKTDFINFPAKSYILKEPKGVVLIIGPWNYPFLLTMMPLIGAVASGNCIVLKPSEYATATAQIIAQIIENVFDNNHCKVVQGDSQKAKELTSLKWDHIFFTGSSHIGMQVMQIASKNLIPVTLELGGKNPCIVFDDADTLVSAQRIIWGKFVNTGQTCIAPDILYCHRNVKEKFIEACKNTIENFYGKNPKESLDYGRIINKNHVKRLSSYLQEGNVITGGDYDIDSCYFAPTIMDNIDENGRIMQEEIFGPILPIVTFENEGTLINDLQKKASPLALYIFTNKNDLQEKFIIAIASGSVGINEVLKQAITPYLPFGGIGKSGMGYYHGKYSFDCFTHQRSVIKSGYKGSTFHFPPYKYKLSVLKKFLG